MDSTLASAFKIVFLGQLWSISHLQVGRAKGGREGDKSRDGGKADEDVLLVWQTDSLAARGQWSGRLGHDQLPANVVVYVHLPMLCSLLFLCYFVVVCSLFVCAPAHVVLAPTTRLDEEELRLSN